MDKIAKIIIQKLTKKQLGILCDLFDDGGIRILFENYLLPEDKKNFPEEYIR